MNDTNIVTDIESQPWYQSSAGPQISTTVKALSGLLIPLLMNMHIISSSIPWLDSLIDALCIIGFGGYALYGYIRAKMTYKAALGQLSRKIEQLSGTSRV